MRDGVGNNVVLELYPRPIQPRLPLWLTCTKHPETFVKAGELGLHVLTALIDMTPEELAGRLVSYRRALAENGYDPAEFTVTLMLHTFLGQDVDQVREIVRQPFTNYLRSFLTVVDSQQQSLTPGQGVRDLSRGDQDALLAFGFEKYFQRGCFFGMLESCSPVVERMRDSGVDEIACLMDFGVDEDLVLDSLRHLDELRARFA